MFRVKAVYDYASPHADDLSFSAGQLITVTEEEDADWYVGEYTDDSGATHHGLFPRNFVERFEPQPPPRPNRASRLLPAQPEPAQSEQPQQPQQPKQQPQPEPVPVPQQPEPQPESPQQPQQPQPQQPPPLQVPPPDSKPAAASPTSVKSPDEQSPADSRPRKAPPPIAAKSNAFRDRIAAFNQPAAAPIQPFKAAAPPPTFVKKPFVAPPPSRNAYVPPPKEAPQVKSYRRDEDPEIADRQAQDQDAAERSGLTANNAPPDAQDEGPKLSLKERIALLQKQQQEQAERAAAAMQPKEKPKRPVQKKRLESHDGPAEDSEDTELEKVVSATSTRASTDHARPRPSHDIKSPDSLHNRDMLSDANDADQSGAGETEDQGDSTSVEGDDKRTVNHPPDHDEQEPVEEEEEEEDEMDAETRRKLELRERMAKMSGGMGMPGMFGGIPMGGLPPKKKKSTGDSKKDDPEEPHVPQQRVAMFPMPGMPVRSPEPENRQLAVEKEDEADHPVTSAYAADHVPDVEDMTPHALSRTPTAESAPPVPQDSKHFIPRKPVNPDLPLLSHLQLPYAETVSKTYVAFDDVSEYVMTVSVMRRPAPPVPAAGAAPPVPTSRPVPPPPPITSPSPGSESGDELTDVIQSPRSPPPFPPAKRASYFSGDEAPDSPDRRVPPIPLASPTSPSARLPPPPPPTAAPGAHRDAPAKKVDHETDYEGDYDTDIASGDTHKDALKSHARDPSLDASTIGGSPIIPHGIPPLPLTTPRAVPPPPPQQPPSRPSMDAPRAAPPLPPVPPPRPQEEDDDEYDPFKYTAPVASPPSGAPPVPRGMPPLPQSRPPPPMPPAPPVPQQDSSDEDDLYSAPAPRKSHDRPPPPPPQAPPHMHAPPPLPQERAPPLPQDRAPPPPQERAPPLPQERAPPPPQERAPPPPPPHAPPPQLGSFQTPESQPRPSIGGRKSLDAGRTLQSRVSMDQQRPQTSQDFMASDVDVGAASHWWTQPKLLPPSLQARKDVLVDLQESQAGSIVEKLVSVLFMDYSQTIISARFEITNPSDVELDQRQEPPPPRLRPDQLEAAYEQFGRKIGKDAESKQGSVVGTGTPFSLVDTLLKSYPDALPPVSPRAYGALVYANLANASTQSHDEIRPGDIITFRNARFQGKTGAMHAKYAVDVGKPDHVGVVLEWDGSKKKVRVWEQGREHKKVKNESFKMGDLRSGEVRIWRVMSRAWVGWR